MTGPPAALDLDPFYKKYVSAGGLPIVSSENVADEALLAGRSIVLTMLANRPDLLQAIIRQKTIVAIIGRDEVTTDIPAYRDLNKRFPKTDWNRRTRGVGATKLSRTSSAAEENLLGLAGDRYAGESIMVHEFAHTIAVMGLETVEPDFPARIKATYERAMARGLWPKTYAATNPAEYWAEGVQSWFNANLEADPANGIHNHVNTRAELKAYDPALAELIGSIFRND